MRAAVSERAAFGNHSNSFLPQKIASCWGIVFYNKHAPIGAAIPPNHKYKEAIGAVVVVLLWAVEHTRLLEEHVLGFQVTFQNGRVS